MTEYRFGRSAMVVFNNLNSVRRKYHLVLLVTWDFSKFGCLIFKSATAKDFRLQGSELFPPAKRKCDLFRQVAFSFGFRSRWSLHPSVIEMLGRSEFALRQGFACGKTLVRRKGAAGQKAGWMLLKKNCKRPERIWIVTPCQN